MRILIISDSHGSLPDVRRVFETAGPVDGILHAGDVLYHGPRNPLPPGYTPKDLADWLSTLDHIRYVRGNCDSEVDRVVLGDVMMPRERIETIDGIAFYLSHGDRSSEAERVARAKRAGAVVAVSGHTHIGVLRRVDGIAVLNPGSTTLPKDGTKSFALYEDGWLSLRQAETGQVVTELALT